MKIIISPAKTLDFESASPTKDTTNIFFPEKAEQLNSELQKLGISDLEKLMHISRNLATQNFERIQKWEYPFNIKDTKQALFAFKGEVYTGIKAETLTNENLRFTQKHLRILSGLYGIIKPLDAILPYRLEMGTKLQTSVGPNLYTFWGNLITDTLNEELKTDKEKTIINLASSEYFKAINQKLIQADIITPTFKDLKNGKYKIISFFAKKARGLMTRFIIENEITNAEELLAFNEEGYYYNSNLSKLNEPVFTRDHE